MKFLRLRTHVWRKMWTLYNLYAPLGCMSKIVHPLMYVFRRPSE